MLNRIQVSVGRKWPEEPDVVVKKARLHLSDVVPGQTVLPWPLIFGRDYRVLRRACSFAASETNRFDSTDSDIVA